MASATRQLGRRGGSNPPNANIGNSDSGVALSPSSTGSTATPPRRYVLDVPPNSRRRTTSNQVVDEYDDTNTRRSGGTTITYTDINNESERLSRSGGATITYTDINNENSERLSRSGSREYYYRDSGNYVEDSAIKQLIESNSTYATTAMEDQEVQQITSQATPDIKNYPINVDPNPELVVRPNTQRITYKQDIAVRYLKPNTPPPPGVKFDFYSNLSQ